MNCGYSRAGILAACLALLALCACSPGESPSAQAQDNQEYPGLTFSVDYQDQDEDGYMETVHLFVGTPTGPHCVTFKDKDRDDNPDFVVHSKIPPGLFTSDLDGDGRFDLYNDAETESLKLISEDSLVEVE